jgi:hypothetical protein
MLAERTTPVKDPDLSGLRALQRAHRSAVKAGTAAGYQIKAILVMALEPVRAKFRGLSVDQLVAALLRGHGFYADPITPSSRLNPWNHSSRYQGWPRLTKQSPAHLCRCSAIQFA